ncbi:hypothetical protein SASPL_118617 [Salvia splendens]|uniref:Transmembrane protein n=1 Tax=Salvia splendens TaxID=180675 RepID=A0A8X8XX23_SALSN|nr:uncharacterized protein LOC121809143 [Salvia splendens]KAG6422055.1 hypothetical protein SASPL_118617 [Salvia splendens]
MFICGRRSFIRDEDRDKNESPHSTPKRSKNTRRNPYAERGLDRFHTLLAHLEGEKQKIYNQIGAEEVSFVRFVYSDSFKNVRPVVVRAKNNNNSHLEFGPINNSTTSSRDEEICDEREEEKGEKMMMCKRWNIGSLCFGVMMVLVFVAFRGRSFAILCTTFVWYLVPLIFGRRNVI